MSYKILLADDDSNLVTSLSARLRAEGYEVIIAKDSYQAVHMARAHWPDLLLLDLHMPAGDGFSAQQRIQQMVHLDTVPVIYLTGERSEQTRRKARELGAVAVLHKPFETAELLRQIEAAVGRRAPTARGLAPA